MKTPEGVKELADSLQKTYSDWDNYALTVGWDRVILSGVTKPENRRYIGLTVADAADRFADASCTARNKCGFFIVHHCFSQRF